MAGTKASDKTSAPPGTRTALSAGNAGATVGAKGKRSETCRHMAIVPDPGKTSKFASGSPKSAPHGKIEMPNLTNRVTPKTGSAAKLEISELDSTTNIKKKSTPKRGSGP